ncbi:hypothetical protein [Amorphus sp. MBR-141]
MSGRAQFILRSKVYQTPVHRGDGYDWGGDWMVTIGGLAINLGGGDEAKEIAHLIAAAPDMQDALETARPYVASAEEGRFAKEDSAEIDAALAKSRGAIPIDHELDGDPSGSALEGQNDE